MLLLALLDRLHALHDARAPADDGHLFAFADGPGLADGQDVLVFGDLFAERPVDPLRFEEDAGIRVPEAGDEEALGVVGGARHHDLQAGLVDVDVLGGVAVQLGGVDAAAHRHADGQRDGEAAASPGSHSRGVGADLVVRGPEEAVELDLRDRSKPGHREADRGSDDAALGERRVDHAVFAEALLQAFGHAEDAAVDADVFAEEKDPVVLLHLLDEGEVDRLYECEVGHRLRSVCSSGPGGPRKWSGRERKGRCGSAAAGLRPFDLGRVLADRTGSAGPSLQLEIRVGSRRTWR